MMLSELFNHQDSSPTPTTYTQTESAIKQAGYLGSGVGEATGVGLQPHPTGHVSTQRVAQVRM